MSVRIDNWGRCRGSLVARAIQGAAIAVTIGSASAAPDSEPAAKARTVLETHCARCHETGKLENPPAKGDLGNVLQLDRLIEREDLVVPGDPDASRLYQIMLSRHRPLSVFFGPVPGPSAADIGAVRDWLAALPPRPATCAKTPVTLDDIRRDMAAWRQVFETDALQPMRFVSLANLNNLCRSDATLAAYRDAVATLIGRLTLRASVALDTVGEASTLMAFRPSDLGLTAEAWDLRAGPGDEIPGLVDAESLAARARAAHQATALASGAAAGPISAAVAAPSNGSLLDGLDPVDALALEYTRTVTAERAAVELHLDRSAMRQRLAERTGEEETLALRLLGTGLPRAEWERLKRRLNGRKAAAPDPPAPAAAESELRLALWTNAPAYKSGDLLTVYARPSGDCNLTLIAVEPGGLATVLFPNDWAVDNRVAAGSLVQVPPAEAPFQLRLDKPGRNGLIAICNATAKRPQGVGHDFERQRFTVLGDWRTFLLEAAEREAAYQKAQDELRRFRTGAGRAAALEEQLPLGTEDEARAGLTLEVAP